MMCFRKLQALVLLMALQSCTLEPEYKKPTLDMPDLTNEDEVVKKAMSEKWWTMFNDKSLDRLEAEALRFNDDIELALSHIEEAAAAVGIARGDLFPSIGVGIKSTRTKTSKKSPMYFSGAAAEGMGMNFAYISEHTISLGASYELDFFGKYRMLTKAAQHDLVATMAARDVLTITITANVARAYFAWLAMSAQLEIANRIEKITSEQKATYLSMREVGHVDEKDYLMAAMQHKDAVAAVAELRVKLDEACTSLSLLVGRSPRDIVGASFEVGSFFALDPLTELVPAGIPSDILLRRPDIRQVEEEMISANAEIGAVRAAFFPSFSLTAAFGFDSRKLGDMFRTKARTWNAGAGANLPLFTGGKTVFTTEAAKARLRGLVARYKKTVKNVFKEVLDALTANRESLEVFSARGQQFSDAIRTYEIAKQKRGTGMISRIELLEAERALLQAKLGVIMARYARLAAVVDLCRVLGGGWMGTNLDSDVDAENAASTASNRSEKSVTGVSKSVGTELVPVSDDDDSDSGAKGGRIGADDSADDSDDASHGLGDNNKSTEGVDSDSEGDESATNDENWEKPDPEGSVLESGGTIFDKHSSHHAPGAA